MGERDPRSERRAIEEALVSLVSSYGFIDLRLDEVLARAGVDQSAFERHFPDLESCFAASWKRIDDERRERTAAAFRSHDEWREGFRAALAATLDFLAHDPVRARFYVLEMISAPEPLAHLREEALKRARRVIAAGDPNPERPEVVANALADGIAGGIWLRLSTLIGEGRAAELPTELPQLMYFVVLPYFGRRAADEELARA